jgi:hypothetical protein
MTRLERPKADLRKARGAINFRRLPARTTDQSVSLDDVANDGSTGELDNIKSDVENADRTGNDVVTGSALANSIENQRWPGYVNAGDGRHGSRWMGNDYSTATLGGPDVREQPAGSGLVVAREARQFARVSNRRTRHHHRHDLDPIIAHAPDNDVINGANSDTIYGQTGRGHAQRRRRDSIFGNEGDDSDQRRVVGDDIIEGNDGNDTIWQCQAPQCNRKRSRGGHQTRASQVGQMPSSAARGHF